MSQPACESVGVDLGTTYSSLAYMDAQMTPRVVCDSNGQAVMPSVVFFDELDVIVGEMALSQAKLHADRVAQFVKVHMGDEWRKEFNGKIHTPESISALILGQLIREAEPEIGPIRRAVITVPAYFTEKRRRATQQAGEIAGLEVLGTLNEPMAATLAYGLYRADGQQNAVVYDLGGGTFDVTVVRIGHNELKELATNGNRQLGGRDWDRVLIDYCCDDFKRAHQNDPRDSAQALQDLQIECERAKRRLGRMNKTAIRLHAFGNDHTVEVTRDQFEELTAHLVHATKLTTEIALEDAKLTWSQISRIVLVGGSTHMPSVRNMLYQTSGIQPDVGVNPVTAVALGAAVYAHMLETGNVVKAIHQLPKEPKRAKPLDPKLAQQINDVWEPPSLPPVVGEDKHLKRLEETVDIPTVKFVTAHGVGLKVHTGGTWRNVVMISKNTQVPCHATQRFGTKVASPGKKDTAQNVSIEITQGDTPDCNLAETLGIGRIELTDRQPPGKPVDVTMAFDEQGRLHTRATYVATGQSMEMAVDVAGGLQENDVEDYRNFMETAGFTTSFNAVAALAEVEELDDDEIVDIDDMVPLDDDEDDCIPMIEPV